MKSSSHLPGLKIKTVIADVSNDNVASTLQNATKILNNSLVEPQK
jgi:hypothetical protein